jgi:hypothetical protein
VCLPATRVRDHGRQEHHLNKVDKPSWFVITVCWADPDQLISDPDPDEKITITVFSSPSGSRFEFLFLFYFKYRVIYSTLLHLPPVRFH